MWGEGMSPSGGRSQTCIICGREEQWWWAGSRAEEKQGSKAGVRDFSTERSYEDEVMKFQTQFKVTTVIYTLPGVLCFAAYFILSL